jgi:hypothetical protein
MKKALVPLLVGLLLLSSCASSGLRQDCRKRKQKVERVASLAPELRVGLTAQEVRALVGEPDEIISARGLGDLETWKYYLNKDCKVYLGLTAPVTELFFLDGKLVKHLTHAE